MYTIIRHVLLAVFVVSLALAALTARAEPAGPAAPADDRPAPAEPAWGH
jgi:hypothetical protein